MSGADVFPALGPGGADDYRKLQTNDAGFLQSEVAAYDNFDPQILTVGTSEVAFPAPGLTIAQIIVQAASTNSASIFVGETGVTSSYTTGAIEILPGGLYPLPIKDYSILRAISGTAGQKLFVTYVG